MEEGPIFNENKKLMLVAVEPSGDALGAALIRSLVELGYDRKNLIGCGGHLMEQEGFVSAFSIGSLSVMGFTDVVRAYPEAKKRMSNLKKIAQKAETEDGCAGIVFIDGWAFSRIASKAIRDAMPDLKIFKYVAPQIWASRPQRIHFVKDYFDGVLTLLPFEQPLFEKENIKAQYVGNWTFQSAFQFYDTQTQTDAKTKFRDRHGLGDAPILAVLPGSRKSEVVKLSQPFLETVDILRRQIKTLQIVIPVAPAVKDQVRERYQTSDGIIFVEPNDKYSAFYAADAALATSGTVTTELAIMRTPMVIAYRVDPFTALWARAVINTPFVSVLNVMAGRAVIPEFIQKNCRPVEMARTLRGYLMNAEARQQQIDNLNPAIKALALDGPGASDIAAKTLVSWMD